jgi:transcriptional regulator with XRE-family HTH domain
VIIRRSLNRSTLMQQFAGGMNLKYPNLLWAITNWGAHYRLAQAIGRSEARLSRCLSGRTQFTAEERQTIAQALGYPAEWLFEEPQPPTRMVATGLVHANV